MNELIPKPVGYTKEAVLYGYQKMAIVDAGTIGRLLYPEAKNPVKQILNIYNRNKEQFDGNDTVLLEVDTPYFWNPRGTWYNRSGYPRSRDKWRSADINLMSTGGQNQRDMCNQIDYTCPHRCKQKGI